MYSALSRQSRVGPLSGTARYSLVTALALFLCAPPASALVHMGEAELILADGTVPRVVRTTSWEAPELAQKAWRTFQAQPKLSKWQALWDSDTAVPLRLYGPGIEVRGSVNSAAIAERAAHDFLTQHRALLAPGSAVGDFRVVANDLDTGMRTVGFIQSRGGLDVVGGRYNVRFKNDRLFVVGSEALPHVPMPARTVAVMSDAELGERARVWVAKETGGQATLDKVMGPTIIPLLQEGSLPRYATVVEVIVNTKTPVGRYQVMLDIETGAPVSRRQMLKFYEATLSIDATKRWPGGERYNAPVPVTRVSVDGEARTTSEAGKIDLGEAETMSIVASVQSDRVAMYNSAGEEITETLELRANETTVWSHSDEEYEDAQLSAFVAANVARDRGRIIAPDMAWLTEEALQVTVNMEEQTCNAYSDGTTINFFRGSRDCHNTARLTDVVTHEFGHSFHAHSIIWGVGDFDTALSEGAADYMAATISDDPDMGRGFFRTNGPLRRLNDRDMRWPEDIGNDPHYTGLIFGGAMWDLREELRKTMGEEEGVAYSDWLMYQALKRSPDIPSSFIEILAADDDDGDLLNGTPYLCSIVDTFANHGLATPELSGGLQRPVFDGVKVRVPMAAVACEGRGLRGASLVVWNRDEGEASAETFDMPLESGHYEQVLPEVPAGVVQMVRVKGTMLDGSTSSYPVNAADPWYQVFQGEVEPIYCTDFEPGSDLNAWDDQLLEGEEREGANDWMVGKPMGVAGSGDPSEAYSGEYVVGNDLGGGEYNGMYQADKRNVLISPYIDVTGYENVRLQYRRWLNVEDGFYDQATIYANDGVAWTNTATGENGTLHHEDREWRFHDVDVTSFIERGGLQIKYEIKSDGGLEMGGWTIDDFCIVGFTAPVVVEDDSADGAGTTAGGDMDGSKAIDGAGEDEGCAAVGANAVLVWMLLGLGLLRRREHV